jgi:hypothetical protein
MCLSHAEGGQVAIFDATNTTKERRQQLVSSMLLLVGGVGVCKTCSTVCVSPQLQWGMLISAHFFVLARCIREAVNGNQTLISSSFC